MTQEDLPVLPADHQPDLSAPGFPLGLGCHLSLTGNTFPFPPGLSASSSFEPPLSLPRPWKPPRPTCPGASSGLPVPACPAQLLHSLSPSKMFPFHLDIPLTQLGGFHTADAQSVLSNSLNERVNHPCFITIFCHPRGQVTSSEPQFPRLEMISAVLPASRL